MEQVIKDVKIWVKGSMITKTFKKGTHRNLLKLIAAYLDIEIPGYSFKFSKPETIDNARFGQKANLFITLALLSDQLDFLTPEQHSEVSTMVSYQHYLSGLPT